MQREDRIAKLTSSQPRDMLQPPHGGKPLRDRLAIDTRCDLKPVQVEKSNKIPRGVK